MRLNNFFRVSWMVQLLVGLGLFSVSFIIENQVMQAFLSAPLLALFLTITLEIGKAMAIVWHRYMLLHSAVGYPLSTRITSYMFRLGLVVLSLLCSLLFLASHLDRPNLEAVRASELESIQKRQDTELARLDALRDERMTVLASRHKTEQDDTHRTYRKRIIQLQRELKKEMDNVVGGVFKGPRYLEIERLLQGEKAALKGTLKTLSERYSGERDAARLSIEKGLGRERHAAISEADQQKKRLFAGGLSNDERVNDARIVSFLNMTDSIFQAEFQPLQFVFLFSLLLSILMELGILLAFDTVTIAMLPALCAQHEAEVETEILKTRVAGEAEREDILHDSELERVTKRAHRTMEEAESILGKFSGRAA